MTALGIPCLGFSQLCHVATCTCVCASHRTVRGFLSFGASTVTSLKHLALFAVGGMRLVYSRWVISATTWSCCQVGWQSTDCLWITLHVCAWAEHSLEGIYRLNFCFYSSAGAWSYPTKEGIFLFENVYENPLCFPDGVQNIHRKGLVLLPCQLPVLRCLACMDFLG